MTLHELLFRMTLMDYDKETYMEINRRLKVLDEIGKLHDNTSISDREAYEQTVLILHTLHEDLPPYDLDCV